MKNNLRKKSLKYSTVEGSLWAFMYGMGENYLSALAVFLGFSALQISFLNSFPQLIGSILQLFSNSLLDLFKSTKRFIILLALMQSVLWLVLIIVIIYHPEFKYLVAWFIVYFLCNSFIGPAWTSWMGYLVPKRIRGTYYGSRNRIINAFVLIAILLGGFILKKYDNNLVNGFLILFTIAFVGRLISVYFLTKKQKSQTSIIKSKKDFIYFLKQRDTSMFFIFKILLNFAVMFLGPLFTIYILRTLGLSNFILSICTVSWWISNVFSAKYWGNFSKVHGNMRILKITTIILSVLPLPWILTYYSSGYFQIFFIILINLFAGFTFSGFSLASFNLVYELVEQKDVVKYSSLLHLGEGSAIFFGSISAGFIVDSAFINDILVNLDFTSIQFSMLISMLLRFACLGYVYKLAKNIK